MILLKIKQHEKIRKFISIVGTEVEKLSPQRDSTNLQSPQHDSPSQDRCLSEASPRVFRKLLLPLSAPWDHLWIENIYRTSFPYMTGLPAEKREKIKQLNLTVNSVKHKTNTNSLSVYFSRCVRKKMDFL